MLLYYITDRRQFPGDERDRRRALLRKIAEASRCGVDFIQLREKDLCTRDLEGLTRAAIALVRENSQETRLLINSRSDVAMACGVDGVHLRSEDVTPREVRRLWNAAIIAVSCHAVADVSRARTDEANFTVLAPVFEKKGTQVQPVGIDALRAASRQNIRTLALGGITLQNAPSCTQAGAAGVAGIRLFQENEVAEVVRKLRN